MSKFSLIKVDDYVEWDEFVGQSPQGSIFSNSRYLGFTGKRYTLYYITKGNEVRAGISLILTDDGTKCEYDDLIIYSGIIFKEDKRRNKTKARSERFKITEFIINELVQKYNRLEMQLSPQFEDLRPFLWHNYHSSNIKDKFTINLRYTSYIDLSRFTKMDESEEIILFKDLEQLRRRNIKEARKDGASVITGLEVELFLDFYYRLMFLQGEKVPSDKLSRMGNLIHKLIENGQAQMFLTKNSQDKIIYITVFCFDSKRAYYLFGAGDSEAKERYKGTIAFWDAFRILKEDYGIRQVDFEGVNSPQRGWFKLSFGGTLLPYYQLILE